MRITLRKQGIELDDAQRDHIELRLQFALGRVAPGHALSGSRGQYNGRRGGVDKRCQLVTRVTGLDELIVEEPESPRAAHC